MKTLEFSRLLALKLKQVHFVLEPFGVNQGKLEVEFSFTSGCRPRSILEDQDYILLGS